MNRRGAFVWLRDCLSVLVGRQPGGYLEVFAMTTLKMLKTLKAFFTRAPMQFEMRDVDIEPLASDEVLVQVKACGV